MDSPRGVPCPPFGIPRPMPCFSRFWNSRPRRRAAFLHRACGDDAALAEQVRSLLAASEQAGSFLNAPLVDSPPTIDSPTERLGARIGPYKLLQQIGEGGFGIVYMAEQEEPVRRLVALKIIKPGMDTGQVIARFESERQALALMDHPNIARVLDAGATESGRPYFVMELVKGVPITEFCDQNHMPAEAAAQVVHRRLPRDPACASQGGHSSRHQAVQRHGHAARRRAGGQGDRLRRGQGHGAAAHGEDALHGVRANDRHARLHEPRAGGNERARYRYAIGHLLAGRAALRAADGHDPARPKAAARGGLRRDAADDPRRRSRRVRARVSPRSAIRPPFWPAIAARTSSAWPGSWPATSTGS